MRKAAVRVLAFSLLALVACQDEASKLSAHMERGQQYLEEKSYPEAIIEFRSALQLDPNLANAHYGLAQAYFASQKPREGYWELRETVRLDPAKHDARLEFAQLAIIAQETEVALEHASAVVEAEPQNFRARLVKGRVLDALERRDEALEAYEAGLALAPDDEMALQVLGTVYQQRGMYEPAEELLVKLVELHPTTGNFSGYARFLGRRGVARRDDQEVALKRALELAVDEERQPAYARLASFYVMNQRLEEGFGLLEEAIAQEEDKLQLIYLLARLHRGQGNKAKADELIESTANERPDDPQVHMVLSAYRSRNGDYEGALAASERSLELAPDDKVARLQKAEVLMELGFRDGREGAEEAAEAIVEGVLADEPSEPRGLFVKAKLELGRKQPAAAVQALRAATDAQPDWAQAHYLLGVALALSEEPSAARNELARALELDAGLLDAKRVLAQLHYRLQEWSYTVERGREFLTEQPEDDAIRIIVAQSLIRLGRIDEAQAELARVPAEQRGADVLYAMGRIQGAKQDFDAARELLLQAEAARPGEPEILEALLALDRREQRLDESRARIAAAIEARDDDPRLYLVQAQLALIEGRGDDAEASYQRAIQLAPSALAPYEGLARYYAARDRLDDTARVYERALEANPDNAQIHHYLGVLYELSGEHERAIERYEDAIRHGPDLGEAKNNLAYLYADSGENLDRALDLAQEAKALMPDNPSVADTLGWVLFKRGVPSAAIPYLKEAEDSTKPQDASLGVVRFHLAQAYAANGDVEQALAAIDRSLEALEEQREAAGDAGAAEPAEPTWASEARALRENVSGQLSAGS
jgi:tetratricopeptide (TPR) repeat protein